MEKIKSIVLPDKQVSNQTRSVRLAWFGPWQVILLIVLAFTTITLSNNKWNPIVFIQLGGKFDPTKSNQSLGYDGQFYYQIARDPVNAGNLIDVPAYRYQRILYPILARILAFGQDRWIPWTLILINLISIPLGTMLTASILEHFGANPWYSIVYGLFIGTILSLRLDLTEPLAFLGVQAAVLLIIRKRPWLASMCFACATLTRENTLLFVAGYSIYFLSQRKILWTTLWTAVAAAPFVLWHLVLKIWLGSWGLGSGGALAAPIEVIPYHGWWGFAGYNTPLFIVLSLLVFPMAILPSILSLGSGILRLVREGVCSTVWPLLCVAALFAFLPISIVYDPLGLSRVTLALIVAVINFGGEVRSKRILVYSLLWLFVDIFLYGNSFFPFSP